MGLFLFLITIFCLSIITSAEPFIDCSGKSFLCENATHFTICVDVGGGVSMTVGNIVLSCPPTTFCDEDNAFECEYRTTPTTPNSISQGTDIPTDTTETIVTTETTEAIEARHTTNFYDEFLFTSDSQQAEEKAVFPTQQKYIIPGNANVIFDDTDNAVLVYGNIESETVNSTPANEKVTKTINTTKGENINNLKNKELTPRIEETRHFDSTKIPKISSKVVIPSKSTGYFNKTKSTTPKMRPEKYAQNATISNSIVHLFKAMTKIANESVTSKSSKTTKKYTENSKLSKDITPIHSSGQQIKTDSKLPNKTVTSILSTPSTRFVQNASFRKDVLSSSSAHPIKTKSTIPVETVTSNLKTPSATYAENKTFSRDILHPDSLDFNLADSLSQTTTLRNDKFRNIDSTILLEDVHPTTVKNVTPYFSTITKTYILNGIMSNPIIPPESAEFDITFGDILREGIDLKTPKQIYLTEKAILNPTIKPDYLSLKGTRYTIHDNDLRTNISGTSADSITDKKFHLRNKNTKIANVTNKLSKDGITARNTAEIITDKRTSGMEYLNAILHTNAETITVFPIENLVTLQQTNSYQTTSRSIDLGDIKKTLIEEPDFSVFLFPANSVETLVTELGTTPQTYINNIISNPIVPNEFPEFDISFGDLIKGNKDFIELKSPLEISLTERPTLGFTGKTENRKSMRNFRSASHNSSNYEVSNSTEKSKPKFDMFNSTNKNTHNMSVTNVTVIDEKIVKNGTVIVAYKSLNKDLLLNNTNTLNSTLQIPNAINQNSAIRKEIIEKIQDIDKILSPIYNLTNEVLNIYNEDIGVTNYTNSNKTMENARVIDKEPTSNVLIKNVTEGKFENLNQKDIEETEIIDTATSIMNDIRKDNKIIQSNVNNKSNESIHSTQSPSNFSYYFTNTENSTINDKKHENKTINSINDNKTDLFNRVILEHNMTGALKLGNIEEILRNNSISTVEDMTEPIVDISNSSIDLLNNVNYTESSITVNSTDQIKDITGNPYMTEVPMLKSTTLHDKITKKMPAILFNGNTKDRLNTSIFNKEIDEKILTRIPIASPKYDASNHMLNMTTVPSAEKGHTIQYDDSATLTVNENLKTDKPISNVLLKNIEAGDSKNVNDENIDHLEITNNNTFINNDKRKKNKIIRQTDSELLNDTLNVLNYSTQSSLETSNYLTNTEGITISYDQNRTIASFKNNTAEIENQPHMVKNIEHENSSRLYNTENTERTLHPPTTISNESIFNDTFRDMMKNNQTALPNSSINSEGQTTDLTVLTHYHKEPNVNSSLMIKNRQNRQDKPLFEEVEGIENAKEFTSNIPTIVTRLTSHKPTIRTNSIIDDKANGTFVSNNSTKNTNQFYSTEHIISDYSTPILTTTGTTMTTESVRLTTKSEYGHITSRSLRNNNETSATKTPIYKSYNKALSKKRHYQNTLYDALVNSIIKDQIHSLQVSSSTNKNEQQTTSRLENTEENVIKGDTGQVNNYATIISSGKFLNASNSSKSENSTMCALNETNDSETKTNIATSKVSFNDDDLYETLHVSEINVIKGDTGQVNNYATIISSGKFLNASNSSKSENSTMCALNETNDSETKTNIATSNVSFNDDDLYETLHVSEINVITPANISHEFITKFEQENLNSESNINLSHPKLISREDLDITGHNDTTKSCVNNAKAQVEISVDKVTEQSQHNIKNLTTLSKNEALIQKCSNKSVCINQGNGQVSIEFYNKTRINVLLRNKTDSKIKETRVRDNRNVSNTTISTPKTELVTDNKLVMQTEKYNDCIISLIPTHKLQSQESRFKTNVESPKSAVTFDCRNHSRGRYADKDNCRKFYICIGYSTPIVGFCPENTVFSEFKKQCTNNLSHCIRNNQFKCVKDGRFLDVFQDNMYYLCIKGPKHRFLRLKLQCKRGYILDQLNVMCKQGKQVTKLSSSTSSNSSSSSSSSDKKKNKKTNKKSSKDTRFKCNEEGLFVDPNDCRKYYICSKTSKFVMRRKRKKCDSDEVFDDDKKKCVDEDSYECK